MEAKLQHQTTKGIYDLNVQHAELSYTSDTATLSISRDKGNRSMKSTMAKLKIDTFEARASVVPTTFRSIKEASSKAKEHASQVIEQLVKETQLMLKSKIGEPAFPQIDAQRNQKPTGEFALTFLPNVGPNIEYTPPDLTIDYEQDKLNFDCRITSGNFDFTPANTDLIIKQKPKLDIIYLGTPDYTPMNFSPTGSSLDVKA